MKKKPLKRLCDGRTDQQMDGLTEKWLKIKGSRSMRLEKIGNADCLVTKQKIT